MSGSQMATGARAQWRGIITEYRDRLPVTAGMPPVTLQEGGTPLLDAPVLSARTGCDVYLKVEGLNPTGSFKDRGMTTAITVAAAQGAKAVICASTGNTSASAAAYAARAGRRGVRAARRVDPGGAADEQGRRRAAHHRHARGPGRRPRRHRLRTPGTGGRAGGGERDAGRRRGRLVSERKGAAVPGRQRLSRRPEASGEHK